MRIVDPENMNLLGLLLASLLERRLADPDRARHARRLRGEAAIAADGMRVTLAFHRGRVEVVRAVPRRPMAVVEAPLVALVDAALARRRIERFVRGQLRVRGRPRALLRLLALLRS